MSVDIVRPPLSVVKLFSIFSWLEMSPSRANFQGFLWGFGPLNEVWSNCDPKKALTLRQTASFEPSNAKVGLARLVCGPLEKIKKKKQNSCKVRHPANQNPRNRFLSVLISGPQ
jgi:hypothetical protein